MPVRDETTDKSAQYEWAKSELQRAQVQLRALQAREAAVTSEEAAYGQMARNSGRMLLRRRICSATRKRRCRTICSM